MSAKYIHTISGIKRFLECYGKIEPETVRKFLGINDGVWYKYYSKRWAVEKRKYAKI